MVETSLTWMNGMRCEEGAGCGQLPRAASRPAAEFDACAGVAAEGVEVDLRVGGAGVVAGDGEGAVGVGCDVGADGVGVAGGGGVEERDGGVGSGAAIPGPVAGGVGGEEIDVRADDGLLSAVDAAGES